MTAPHLAQQVGFLFLGRMLAFALVFFLPLFLVRLFNKEVFGLYRQFFVVFYFFFLLCQFGMGQALNAIFPKEPKHAPALLANTTIFLGVLGLIVGGIGFVLYAPNDASLYVYARQMGLMVGLMVAASVFETLLILEQKSREVAILIVGWDVLRALFLVVVAWWTRDLGLALWAIVVAAGVRYLVFLWYVRKAYQLSLSMLSLVLFWRHLRMAVPMWLQSGAHLVETHVDRYLVLFFFSPASFAIYSIGVFHIPIVDMVFHSISGVVLPRLVALYGEERVDEMLVLWNDTIRRSALLFLPMFGGLLLIHEELILLLFTVKYAESVPLFAVFVWIIPTYIVANNSLLQVTEHAWYLVVASILKPAFAAVLVVYGINEWGMLGAVLALVSYHYIAIALYLFLSARALNVSLASLFPMGSVVSIGILTAISYGVAAWACSLIPVLVVRMLCKGLLFTVICFALALFSPLLRQTEREDVLGALDWLRGKVRRVFAREVSHAS